VNERHTSNLTTSVLQTSQDFVAGSKMNSTITQSRLSRSRLQLLAQHREAQRCERECEAFVHGRSSVRAEESSLNVHLSVDDSARNARVFSEQPTNFRRLRLRQLAVDVRATWWCDVSLTLSSRVASYSSLTDTFILLSLAACVHCTHTGYK